MKVFNLNREILIKITGAGWRHLHRTQSVEYIKTCIDRKEHQVEINGEIWHKLQAHYAFELFPMGMLHELNFEMNILIEDKDLKELE